MLKCQTRRGRIAWRCCEDPLASAAGWLPGFGAGPSVPVSGLWNNVPPCTLGVARCAAAQTDAIYGGSFVERLASFHAGAARRRAEALCQVTEVPSMDDGGSPSNTHWRGP